MRCGGRNVGISIDISISGCSIGIGPLPVTERIRPTGSGLPTAVIKFKVIHTATTCRTRRTPGKSNLRLSGILSGKYCPGRIGCLNHGKGSHIQVTRSYHGFTGKVLVADKGKSVNVGIAGKNAGDGEITCGIGCAFIIKGAIQVHFHARQTNCRQVASNHMSANAHSGGGSHADVQDCFLIFHDCERQGHIFISNLMGSEVVRTFLQIGEAVLTAGRGCGTESCIHNLDFHCFQGIATGGYCAG